MKRIFVWLALFGMSFLANAAPASTKSLETLFALTNIEKNVETMKSQMFGLLKSTTDKALEGRKLTPDRQKVMDNYSSRSTKIMSDFLTYSHMKPFYLKVYGETFTQEEIDGLIAFYKTPPGKALLTKTPELTKKIFASMPELLAPMMTQLQAESQQLSRELEALDSSAPN
jgi:hypothetical protein